MHKAKRLRKEDPARNGKLYAEHEKLDNSPRSLFHRTVYRPFHMLLVEPMLVVVTIYLSIVYACLYGLVRPAPRRTPPPLTARAVRVRPAPRLHAPTPPLLTARARRAFPIIWGPPVRPAFTPGLSGLVFVGVGIGTTAGAAINIWLSREYGPLMVKWRGHPPPEPRLKGSMVAGPFFCVGACGARGSVRGAYATAQGSFSSDGRARSPRCRGGCPRSRRLS
jgi:DHA1 family multidrug resistance protein-like MFS transporter